MRYHSLGIQLRPVIEATLVLIANVCHLSHIPSRLMHASWPKRPGAVAIDNLSFDRSRLYLDLERLLSARRTPLRSKR